MHIVAQRTMGAVDKFNNAETFVYAVEQRSVTLLAVDKAQFGGTALVNVDYRADIAKERSTLVEARRCRIDGPSVRSILLAQSVLNAEWLMLGVGGQENVARHFLVVGMRCFEPAKSCGFFQRLTCVIVPGPVQICAVAVGIGHPYNDRCIVRHRPETPFTLGQLFFRTRPLCCLPHDLDGFTGQANLVLCPGMRLRHANTKQRTNFAVTNKRHDNRGAATKTGIAYFGFCPGCATVR